MVKRNRARYGLMVSLFIMSALLLFDKTAAARFLVLKPPHKSICGEIRLKLVGDDVKAQKFRENCKPKS